ncbi:Acyltransferase family protein [Sporothrix brasiliensis 5110]|uniref:Acyltransferase family protein n=1 Tax=Sporothrix brasiliensis 5110 TaxID=1398154 RepID=A0A0C2IIN0_9PEZI|nr:Acyltransferase family protein [Sporothrix brasiliensis 5110]KIH86850.1 Acyltransferase family protein [Sporothrix brasiliensis 5110]
MPIGKEGNVKWVDGFRGLASSLVVLTHLSRSFDLLLFDITDNDNAAPRVVQYPFIRVLFQGRIGVAVFAMVTGYVCALKPIRLSHQGQQAAAFKSMGKSALRRVPRLILPAAFATFLTWLACELGAYHTAAHCDSWWIRATGPTPIPDFWRALRSLLNSVIATWTHGGNEYDANQWTLLPLLLGSFWVYVFMLATAHVRPRYRMMMAMAMWLYFILANDPTFGMQFFFGVFLSDLQNLPSANKFLNDHPRATRVLSPAFLVLGTFVASYPETNPERVGWSRNLHAVLAFVLPYGSDYPRYASGLGVQLIALGLHFSPKMRDVLSNRAFLWLGKQSFAVYLLHGPLLRSVLAWMLYGFKTLPDTLDAEGQPQHHETPFPGMMHLYVSLVMWIPLNYFAAHLWTTYVDPYCGELTESRDGREPYEDGDGGAGPNADLDCRSYTTGEDAIELDRLDIFSDADNADSANDVGMSSARE